MSWTMVQLNDEKLKRAQSSLRKKNSKTKRIKLVISVPSSCGNAALRNRFRRMIRGYLLRHKTLDQLSLSKGLWIRLSANHHLTKTNTIRVWVPLLQKVQAYVEAQSK